MPWPVIGNERAVRALAGAVAAGGVQHAYLFTGPEHVGRATVARHLAQALNCTGEDAPCGECGQCRRIASNIHADVHTVTIGTGDDGEMRKSISIEQMRDVQQAVSLNPYEGRTRVVIIDPADLLQGPAQNSFLKTLEEPPPNVAFVLIASNEDALLDTIRSRSTRIEFSLVPVATLEAALIARGGDPEAARMLARVSGGRPAWAIAASDDPRVLERRQETIATARGLARMTLAGRMELSEKLVDPFRKDRDQVLRMLGDWQAWWRDVLLVQSGAEGSVSNVDMLAELRDDAEANSREHVLRFVRSLGDTRFALNSNVQTRIALDALMMDAPRASTVTSRQTFTGS